MGKKHGRETVMPKVQHSEEQKASPSELLSGLFSAQAIGIGEREIHVCDVPSAVF